MLDRFDNYVDTQIYSVWLSRYAVIKESGIQPFIPLMPEKYFSQNDEDGYLLKICERFNGKLNSFVEIGVGNGLENNSTLLKANGLKGIWIDAARLPSEICLNPRSDNFRFVQDFVTPNNVKSILQNNLKNIGLDEFDILSLDIDGDDFNVLDSLTDYFSPKVIVAEINTKLGPFPRWNYSNSTNRTPAGDNFGTSFRKMKDMLELKNFRLLAINAATGLNAFYVNGAHKDLFPEVDQSIGFVPPFYRWPKKVYGTPSFTLINSILNS